MHEENDLFEDDYQTLQKIIEKSGTKLFDEINQSFIILQSNKINLVKTQMKKEIKEPTRETLFFSNLFGEAVSLRPHQFLSLLNPPSFHLFDNGNKLEDMRNINSALLV